MEINCLPQSTLSSVLACLGCLGVESLKEHVFALSHTAVPTRSQTPHTPTGITAALCLSLDRRGGIILVWITDRQHNCQCHGAFSRDKILFLSLLTAVWASAGERSDFLFVKDVVSHLCYQILTFVKEGWWWQTLRRHLSHPENLVVTDTHWWHPLLLQHRHRDFPSVKILNDQE